jgi:hypothetical protein
MNGRDVHAHDMFDDDPSLSAFASEVREATERGPLPEIGGALAAVLAGHAPATAYPEAEPLAAPRVAQQRRWLRLGLVAAGAAAAVLVFGAAGSLPDPAQRQVARLASAFGVHLPEGDDDGGEPVKTTTTSTSTTSTTVPTTTSTAPGATTTAPVTTAVPATTPDEDDDDDQGEDQGRGNDDDSSGPGRGRDERPTTTVRPDDGDDDDSSGPGGGGDDQDDDRRGSGDGEEDSP